MNIFPRPSQITGSGLRFPVIALCIKCSHRDDLNLVLYFKNRLTVQCNIPVDIGGNDGYLIELTRCEGARESYSLTVSPEKTVLNGADSSGILYGLMTLLQLFDKKTLLPVAIVDKPFKKRRGVHVYMPSRENIPDFLRMIDGLATLKMNTLIIETGAGMEFDRRPEIIAAWKKLTCDVEAFPGGPRLVQASEVYWKDSIHTEIAGGDSLTKAEVRAIVEYAKDLHFDVIPEVQNLSHAYYLTIPYREIAERPNEPFPDSTCPLHPLGYEIYFDVAEEIIEVFKPKTVSIGHDEVRILGYCPRCKDKPGAELLSYEINKLYDFYKARGIEVMMWGEKLMDFVTYAGGSIGGAKDYKKDDRGRVWDLPETHGAIDMISKDIIQLDWYHMLAEDTAKIFTDKGFNKVWYGNFHADVLKNAVKRLSHPGVDGAEVSSWDLACEPTMGRDGIFYGFAWGAGILWSDRYGNDTYMEDNKNIIKYLPYVRNILRGKNMPALGNKKTNEFKIFYRGGENPSYSLPKPENFYLSESLYKTVWGDGAASGTSFLHPEIAVKIGGAVNSLVFITACEHIMAVPHSIDFADTTPNVLGMFYAFYEDGSTEPIELRYGSNTGTLGMDWNRNWNPPANSLAEIDADMGDVNAEAPFFYIADKSRAALSYLTNPVVFTGGDGKSYSLYAYEWINPLPHKKISAVQHVLTIDRDKLPKQMAYLFAVAGSVV